MGKMIDLTGQKFGLLTVVKNAGKLDNRRYYWDCDCDCGGHVTVLGTSLRNGNTKSCGCQKFKGLIQYNLQQSEEAKIPIGTKFGKLTVIEDIGLREQTQGHRRRWYKCQCDCGNITEAMGNALKEGQKISCGSCLSSKGEFQIEELLKQNNIIYNHDIICQELFKETGRALRFDFELFKSDGSFDRFIEFDGRQHYSGPDTTYWGKTTDNLSDIQERDNIKNNFCKEHNYTLIRIPYYYKNITIEDILGNKFEVGKE